VLIINQTDHEAYSENMIDGHLVRMYSTTQRGLSRSRNMALIHAKGDICILADDDCVMSDGYEQMILKAFDRHPNATAITFNYYDPNKRTDNEKHIKKECEAPKRQSFSSVSLAFKREVILKAGVWFNVNFGAGSGFVSAGEESLWEFDMRNKGLKLFQCPEYITEVQQQNSTWFNGFNEKYYYDLGAFLSARFKGVTKYIYQFYYPYRLRKNSSMSIYKQLKWLMAGIKGYSKGLDYNSYIKKI
jgi:Glycosyl transferase family 2.